LVCGALRAGHPPGSRREGGRLGEHRVRGAVDDLEVRVPDHIQGIAALFTSSEPQRSLDRPGGDACAVKQARRHSGTPRHLARHARTARLREPRRKGYRSGAGGACMVRRQTAVQIFSKNLLGHGRRAVSLCSRSDAAALGHSSDPAPGVDGGGLRKFCVVPVRRLLTAADTDEAQGTARQRCGPARRALHQEEDLRGKTAVAL